MMEVYLRYWMNVINSEYSVQFPTNLPPPYNGHNWNVSNCQYADLTLSPQTRVSTSNSIFSLYDWIGIFGGCSHWLAGWLTLYGASLPAAARQLREREGGRSTNLRYWELRHNYWLSPARQTDNESHFNNMVM